MTPYELYTFIICLIVFIALTVAFGWLLTMIYQQQVKLIRGGQEDGAIQKEYQRKRSQKPILKTLERIASGVLTLVLLAVFVFSLLVNVCEERNFCGLPAVRVVRSGSMQVKNKENKYLFENGLDDQINMFDIIFTEKKPAEDKLEKFDIVVYEVDGDLIVHRIIDIEEPNEKHPDQRYFLCRGDAVSASDRYPVLYSQIRGVYRGKRICFVGSFVMFMQSPAGWLCVLLVLVAMVGTPLVERRLDAEKDKRLALPGVEEAQREEVTK